VKGLPIKKKTRSESPKGESDPHLSTSSSPRISFESKMERLQAKHERKNLKSPARKSKKRNSASECVERQPPEMPEEEKDREKSKK